VPYRLRLLLLLLRHVFAAAMLCCCLNPVRLWLPLLQNQLLLPLPLRLCALSLRIPSAAANNTAACPCY
jgi:hypothetical protein